MERRSNLNLLDYKIPFISLVAIQHLFCPPTHTRSTRFRTSSWTSSSVAVKPSDSADGPLVPPVWSLQTVPRIPQKLGFGSYHDVFCHVVAGHAHCHLISPQSISACHVDLLRVMSRPAMTRHIIPCRAVPWLKTHVMSYLVRSCP